MRAIDQGVPSCAKPAILAPFKPRPISVADQAEIKRQADLQLFDGISVRWQWPTRRAKNLYCGFYNGKNQMGAYTGWKPFMFVDGTLTLIGPGDSTVVYEAICSGAGYIPKPEWMTKTK